VSPSKSVSADEPFNFKMHVNVEGMRMDKTDKENLKNIFVIFIFF